MRVLILTCNTGGGHNACAGALREALHKNGHDCESVDAMGFVSQKLSGFLCWGHTVMYRHIPGLFRIGYSFAEKHPAILNRDAALYKLLTGGTQQLREFIRTGDFDAVICSHIFSGLLLTQTLKEYPLNVKTALVATDYTCSPGTAKCEPDYFFIPAGALAEEFLSQGIGPEKLVASGIPVRGEFYERGNKRQTKQALGIEPDHAHLLMMCGSMGCGPMEKLTKLLAKQMSPDMELSVVCGTNEKLRKKLARQYCKTANIHIHATVQDVSALMDSADLYLTKPGGLSSTEAAAKGLPMVLIDAVAGCEAYNCRYFVSRGGAVTADTPEKMVRHSLELLQDPARRLAMSEALKAAIPREAPQQICGVLEGI